MRNLMNFLHDDRGSVTAWNLFWLLNFGVLMGLAIDTTAAMNLKARLQEASDAASSAAVIDVFPVASGATPVAMQYAELNLGERTAVQEQDVTPGFWDHESRTFETEDIPYANAVRVIARRDTSRGNALGTVLLHVAGFNAWDIAAASTSAYAGLAAVDRCRTNGLLADGHTWMTSKNLITGDYCVHGETEIRLNELTEITCGAELSTPSPDTWKTGQPPIPSDTCNEDATFDQMIAQAVAYRSGVSHARAEYFNVKSILDAFVTGQQVNDPFHAIPPYISTYEYSDYKTVEALASNGNLVPGTLYVVDFCPSNQLTLKGIVKNVGFYTTCEITVKRDQSVSNAKPSKVENNNGNTGSDVLCDPDIDTCDTTDWDAYMGPHMTCDQAVDAGYETYQTLFDTAPGKTYRDDKTVDTVQQDCGIEPGANGLWDNVFVFTTSYENGDHSKASVTFPNNMQIGRMDACTEGGGVRIYAGGSVDTPSGTIIHGSQFVLLGNSRMAAKANGVYGTTVNAAGDITFAAQAEVGGCPAEESALASDVIATVRPVMIVD